MVQTPEQYKILRFIAGIGLAGELGAGITLVSEILPKRLRAIGTSLVAGVGLSGAVVAYFTADLFDWRNAYFIGGGMGLLLLVMRIGVFESGLFKNIHQEGHISKGNFLSFFSNEKRLLLYLKCIAIGLPTWFVIGILATFSNEFGKALGIEEAIKPGLAIMWCYVGLATGDLLSGFISHGLHSRRKAVGYMMFFTLIGCLLYLFAGIQSAKSLYMLCLWMGFGIGYWAMFVTIGAEQFGTNLRATAATTIPNMVRGTVVIMTSIYINTKPSLGVIAAASIVGLLTFSLGFISVYSIPETHDRDLDFLEN